MPARPLPDMLFRALAQLLHDVVQQTQQRLFAQDDTFDMSGTTLTAALLMGRHAVVCNVGMRSGAQAALSVVPE